MAEYQKRAAKGGYEVGVVETPGASPRWSWFSSESEAQAWISEQIKMERQADRFEDQNPRWRG
jgi:hypothetical protein